MGESVHRAVTVKPTLFLLITTLLTGAALAQDTPQAASTPGQLPATFMQWANQPTEIELTMEIRGSQQLMTAKGVVKTLDENHFAVDFTYRSPKPGVEDAYVENRLFTVADGKRMWIEGQSPLGRQVFYLPIQRRKQMQAGVFQLGYGPYDEIHPLKAIVRLAALSDMKKVGEKDGKLHYRGLLNEQGKAEIVVPGGMVPDLDRFQLWLDAETSRPLELRFGNSAADIILTTYQSMTAPQKFTPETFEYTPPEGIEPVDMALLLGLETDTDENAVEETPKKNPEEDQ